VRRPELAPTGLAPIQARTDGLRALFVAALGLSTLETVYAHAERWRHEPLYFALSAGLTLALALAVGVVAAVPGLTAGTACALWIGVALGLSSGWVVGVAAGVSALLAARSRAAGALRPAEAGSVAMLTLACAYLKGPALAEHLGRKGDVQLEAIGSVLLVALVATGLPFLLRMVPARITACVPSGARAVAMLALGCVLSLRPLLERGDGQGRQPPAGYASSVDRGAGERPNVVLLVLDTVRADHLSLYGYGRETSPELERLVTARDNAVVFPRAYANGTWTVPSHASLFTGRLPHEHGAHFALDGSVRVGFGLRSSVPTLAEGLQKAGYATLAGYGNHWLRSMQGMGRGFARYLRAPDRDELPFVGEALRERFLPGLLWEVAKGCARATEVNETLLSMTGPWSAGPNPLFVFANYIDAHGPYAPPAPFRGRFAPATLEERSEHLSLEQSPERRAQLMARYDEEIAYLDHQLGELFRALEEQGLLRNSWVFVTADHGEAFGEHGVLEHGTTVHEEVVHVPLIVFPPDGVRLALTTQPVSLVDVAATIAAIGGAELGGPGRDLRALESPGTHPTVLEFYGDPVKAAKLGALSKRPARVVVLGRHKLIAYADSYHLYDVENDPGELVDLAGALPTLLEHMKAFLPEFEEPTFRSDREAPEPEALDALRGLGYGGGP
jgi:arylsulfatase A-like enzyme